MSMSDAIPPVIAAEAAWPCGVSWASHVEDVMVVYCSAHGSIGRVPRVAPMNMTKQREAIDNLFIHHLNEVTADAAQVDSDVRDAVERRQGEPAGYNPANIGKRESSDGVDTITIYVSIGNSDDKLSQRDWAAFIREVTSLVEGTADQVYGWWYSTSDMPWQNAVVAFLLNAGKRDQLRAEVSRLREKYRQDSIAWAEAPRTDFI